jgi:hypothetical protein
MIVPGSMTDWIQGGCSCSDSSQARRRVSREGCERPSVRPLVFRQEVVDRRRGFRRPSLELCRRKGNHVGATRAERLLTALGT